MSNQLTRCTSPRANDSTCGKTMRSLELLAPARDLPSALAAIDCGADAVYIGAEKFGARAAATNSVEDIASVVDYAHRFRAKVYVTLNTLLRPDEHEEMRELLHRLAYTGIDAILVQDMAMLDLTRGLGIPLHASTQTDNRTAERVGWLKEQGFTRVVLARELSLEDIRHIHSLHPDVELEVFVHGALCVSYSGACLASEHFFSRSANRGECAQFCRMKFDLVDSNGRVIEQASHLLSLKDLCLINELEALADAGAVSFKIEGRLKDVAYVRNVVSAYSLRLNDICRRRQGEYTRSSLGEVDYSFVPDLTKTFNRGYTDYFLHGRHSDISCPTTPKVMGERVGVVKQMGSTWLTVAGVTAFANGDGLCFVNTQGELEGFRVNRAEGNRLYPHKMPSSLRKGMELFRNNDASFLRTLSREVATRRIPIRLTFSTTEDGFKLQAITDGIAPQEAEVTFAHQEALKPQEENIRSQLSRWGDTVFLVRELTLADGVERLFVPSSILSSLRHSLATQLAHAFRHYGNA